MFVKFHLVFYLVFICVHLWQKQMRDYLFLN